MPLRLQANVPALILDSTFTSNMPKFGASHSQLRACKQPQNMAAKPITKPDDSSVCQVSLISLGLKSASRQLRRDVLDGWRYDRDELGLA